MPSPLRYGKVKKMLEEKGYYYHRCRGSHHTFKKANGVIYTFPVHKNQVKPHYVEQVKNLE